MPSNKTVILISTVLIIASLFTGFLVSQANIPMAEPNDALNVEVTPRNVKLAPQQPAEFTAHTYNGTAPYTYTWTCTIFGVNNETLVDNAYLGNSNPITFQFNESAAFANLNVEAHDARGATGYATVIVYDPSVFTLSSGVYPGSPSYTFWRESNTYYIKNSYGVIDYSGSDAATVFGTCLNYSAAHGGGTIYLPTGEIEFNSAVNFPTSITQLGGRQRCIEIIGDRTVLTFDESITSNAFSIDTSGSTYYMVKLRGFDIWAHSQDDSYYGLYIENAFDVYLEDMIIGWEGVYLANCTLVHANNLQVTDSSNEGIRISGGGYMFFNNMFLDNCGGWGNTGAYNSLLIEGASRLYFTNFNMYGQKGASGGGQASGIYGNGIGQSYFSNFEIDGFEGSPINLVWADDVGFSNFNLRGSDVHPVQLNSAVSNINNITLTNFKIQVDTAAQNGIGIYAESNNNITAVTISNGCIWGDATGNAGIAVGDDESGAFCSHILASNVHISEIHFGVVEGYSSDYNTFGNIDAYSTDGIFTEGANTHTGFSWNSTTWVP